MVDDPHMTGTATAKIGWYPDPHAPGVLRYYDGERWTPHTLAAPTTAPPAQLPTQGRISAAHFWETSGLTSD